MTAIAPTLQSFFTERLTKQRHASPATMASYRHTFRLLLRFVQQRTGRAPSMLDWDDLGVEVISAFLDHLEHDRHNSPRSRNTRLAAVRSLFRYAALRHPEHAQLIQQVLAIPQKRFDKTTCRSWKPMRSRRCSPPPTSTGGKAAAITRSSHSPSKPGCGSPNSPESPAAISNSASAPTSGAPAKDARNDASH